jgi:hypothetical protein
MSKIWNVLRKFQNAGGALIGLGLIPSVRRLLGLIWHRIQDGLTAFDLWTMAGGNVPTLVKYVSSPFFGPALIVFGFIWAAMRWRVEAAGVSHKAITVSDKIGWLIVALTGFVMVGVMLFDQFLSDSGATQFAEYVNTQKFERHFSADPERTKKLIEVFKEAPKFPDIRVASVDAPEAIAYAREFMVALLNAGQKVNGVDKENFQGLGGPEQARLFSPQMHGLFIGVRPGTVVNNNKEAIRFAEQMVAAGFEIHFMGWEGLPENEFKFVIGPK